MKAGGGLVMLQASARGIVSRLAEMRSGNVIEQRARGLPALWYGPRGRRREEWPRSFLHGGNRHNTRWRWHGLKLSREHHWLAGITLSQGWASGMALAAWRRVK